MADEPDLNALDGPPPLPDRSVPPPLPEADAPGSAAAVPPPLPSSSDPGWAAPSPPSPSSDPGWAAPSPGFDAPPPPPAGFVTPGAPTSDPGYAAAPPPPAGYAPTPPPAGYAPAPPPPAGYAPAPPPPPAAGYPAAPPPAGYSAPPPPPIGYQPPGPGYGYGGYGVAAPATSGTIKGTEGMAKAIAVFAVISAVVSIVAVVYALRFNAIYDGATIDHDDARQALDDFNGTQGLQLLAAIPLGLLWIVWQFRLSSNNKAMGNRPGMAPSSAIWGWLIPGLNLLIGPVALHQSLVPPKRSALVATWAVLLAVGAGVVLAAISSGPSEKVAATPGDIDRMQQMAILGMAGAALLAIAALLSAAVAHYSTASQRAALGN